jgi:hypothetical protein
VYNYGLYKYLEFRCRRKKMGNLVEMDLRISLNEFQFAAMVLAPSSSLSS